MSKGLGLRLHLPDNGAVARSLLGVLIVAAVALYWGPAGAATSVAAAGAVAGAIALQDNPLGRIPIVLAVSVELGAAVLVGGLTASYSVVFVAAVALWCFFAGMHWAVGAPAGLIAGSAGVLLVIQQPQHALAAAASALLAVIAGLTQAALISVWPPRRWRREREALIKVYRSLSADARSLATDPTAQVDPAQLLELKEAFSMKDTQSGRRAPAYRDWHALPEQIAKTLTAFRGKAAEHEAVRDVLIAAADTLAAIATQSHTARRDGEYALKSVDAAVAGVTVSEASVAQRLSRQLHRADALRFGRRHLSDWAAALKAGFETAYAAPEPHLADTAPCRPSRRCGGGRSRDRPDRRSATGPMDSADGIARPTTGDGPHLHAVRRPGRGYLRWHRGRLCGVTVVGAQWVGRRDRLGGVSRRHLRDIGIRLHRRDSGVRGKHRVPARHHRCVRVGRRPALRRTDRWRARSSRACAGAR